jgi:hypothetical protein
VLRQRRLTDACLNKYLPPLVASILALDSPPILARLVCSIGASLHAFAGQLQK